jgi:hypothetical protein
LLKSPFFLSSVMTLSFGLENGRAGRRFQRSRANISSATR